MATATDYISRAVAPSIKSTPQTRKIKGTNQKPNNGGGFSFVVDDWTRLNRWLILGSEGGSYYVGEKKLTKQNVKTLYKCIEADGVRTVDEIVAVSVGGRAAKQEPTLFALAACASAADDNTRAYALSKLGAVARTGTHLFMFVGYVDEMRGWGRGLRSAVADWFVNRENLDYQLVKYKQREGWSMRDVLRLAKPRPVRKTDTDKALAWAVGKGKGTAFQKAADQAHKVGTTSQLVSLITAYKLPWEALPSEALRKPEVWTALLPHTGLGAVIRNLGRLTNVGVLTGATLRDVIRRLTDPAEVRRSRVHPVNVLTAGLVYTTGHGVKGDMTWRAIPSVADALEKTFHLAFDNVEPANKRTLIALDVSGSMESSIISNTFLSARVASAAMAMVTMATEPETSVIGFSGGYSGGYGYGRGRQVRERFGVCELDIRPGMALKDVVTEISGIPFGSTNCALPFEYALKAGLAVDTFIVYTDNETNTGTQHPVQALKRYRQATGIDARLIVVGMTATQFSIADPNDAGMLDVAGFDSAAPAVIADFSAGRI